MSPDRVWCGPSSVSAFSVSRHLHTPTHAHTHLAQINRCACNAPFSVLNFPCCYPNRTHLLPTHGRHLCCSLTTHNIHTRYKELFLHSGKRSRTRVRSPCPLYLLGKLFLTLPHIPRPRPSSVWYILYVSCSLPIRHVVWCWSRASWFFPSSFVFPYPPPHLLDAPVAMPTSSAGGVGAPRSLMSAAHLPSRTRAELCSRRRRGAAHVVGRGGRAGG